MPKNLDIEEVYLKTSDNIKLHAHFLDNKSEYTVLFFHGNAGNISHRVSQLEVFKELELNALIFDYRGYGKSEGNIKKESDLYLDGETALNFLIKQKNIPPEKIIIWGRSLGSAIAIENTQQQNFKALIIESAFTSVDDMAQKQFWILPVKLLLRFHFRNDQKIQNIKSPILIIHSPDDEMIPFEYGQKLFEKAKYPKTFLTIKGSHNGGFLQSRELYISEIKRFLKL